MAHGLSLTRLWRRIYRPCNRIWEIDRAWREPIWQKSREGWDSHRISAVKSQRPYPIKTGNHGETYDVTRAKVLGLERAGFKTGSNPFVTPNQRRFESRGLHNVHIFGTHVPFSC